LDKHFKNKFHLSIIEMVIAYNISHITLVSQTNLYHIKVTSSFILFNEIIHAITKHNHNHCNFVNDLDFFNDKHSINIKFYHYFLNCFFDNICFLFY
jgi:hypothetical protein